MPVVAVFSGIVIRMYFLAGEHNPPHVHALYGEFAAAIAIRTQEVLDGWIPPKEMSKVKHWIRAFEQELMEMWETQTFRKLPSLER